MLHRRHPFFPHFERLMKEAAAHAPTYDLGTDSRFFKEMGLVQHLFDPAEYKAGGYKPEMDKGAANCDFDCDLENMAAIKDQTVGSVVCLSVLEHVLNPHQAAREIHRILKPGGIAVLSVPFAYPYHGRSKRHENPLFDAKKGGWANDSRHSGYGDYWRFTHEGLAYMFSQAGFTRVDVYPTEGKLISRLSLLGLYHKLIKVPFFSTIINKLDQPELGSLTTMHFIRVEK